MTQDLPTTLALSVAQAKTVAREGGEAVALAAVNTLLTVYDLKRVRSYAQNLLDYHAIMDSIPACSSPGRDRAWRGSG